MNWLNLSAIKTARGKIHLPGSKSISNRILLLASLADGVTLVRGLLASDDTSHMLNALRVLGVPITQMDANSYSITGCNGKFPLRHAELSLGNAGTVFRPLVAVLALMQGKFKLSGATRMHERPIADLVDTLRQLGANIGYLENEGYPPLEIKPADNVFSGPLDLIVKGNVSSQFLSSLLIALPLIGNRSTISVSGVLISKPYVELTLAQMKRFDVQVTCNNRQKFVLPGQQFYRSPGEIMVEGDASSASYFLAAGAIGGGPVRVCGVGRNSLQGDICFAEALEKMGANITRGENWIESQAPQLSQTDNQLKAIDLDCNHIPDAAMTLAVVALFARGITTLRNIASWRLKETDRLAAMATELRKLGAQVKEGSDFLSITPPVAGLTLNTSVNTYDDHRMAMCFSLAAFGGDVRINDPGCVSKTFPNYFNQFAKITHA